MSKRTARTPAGAAEAEPATESAEATASREAAAGGTDPVSEHVRWAAAQWPQIDPEVEGIVSRIERIQRYLQAATRASLKEAGLTKEEWKVLMELHDSVRSHGSLCRHLDVSTGAMTNRLDKLEARGLIRRARDPEDRRGVLLELTPEGESRFDESIDVAAGRERELLDGLTVSEKQQLNRLLSTLLVSLQREST